MKSLSIPLWLPIMFIIYYFYFYLNSWSLYQYSTAIQGIYGLLNLPRSEINKCINAYRYLQNGTRKSNTKIETMHVRNYYAVLHEVLAIGKLILTFFCKLLN